MHDFVVPTIAAIIMTVFAVFYGRLISRERTTLSNRLSELERLLVPVEASNGDTHFIADQFNSQAAADEPVTDEVPMALWDEWEKSLAHSPRNNITYRMLDAEDVFTPERLIPGVTKFRGLSAAPSIFTGLGVLFTFIGLAMGFLGLNLGSDATTANSIVESAGRLVAAAGIAFTASIFGVTLSLVFNIIEKSVERGAVDRISKLQKRINDKYPVQLPEHSLVKIADSQQQSTEALQELHERIGNRLQEALEQQSTTIREQLASSIAESLAPAMNKLVTATTEQSSTVFETLIERFASSFTELGAQQRSAMDDSAGRLQSAIDGLGTQVSAVTEEFRAQSIELAERQKQVLQSLEQISGALTSSTSDLENTAESLAVISERFQDSSKALANDISNATSTLEAVFSRLEEQATRGSELTERTVSLSEHVSESSTKLVTAAVSMRTELDRFSNVQGQFRSDLEANAKTLADGLSAHVEQLSQQVSGWLGNYSADVERQIESRMETWNSVSQDYAAKMLATAQALNDAVDELSNRDANTVEAAA